jgi:hypothetical protein
MNSKQQFQAECNPLPNSSVELFFYFAFVNHSSAGYVFDAIP